jgi:cytochrome P450
MNRTSNSTYLKIAPGPIGNPLFGSLLELARDPISTLLTAREQFGDVVKLQFGWKPTFLVCHPSGIQYVLQDNHQNYCKGQDYDQLKSVIGQGLITSEGDLWRKQRYSIQPGFHRQRIISFAQTMAATTAEMLQEWDSKCSRGQPLNVAEEMMHLTLRIASQTLFSADVDTASGVVELALPIVLDHVTKRTLRLVNLPEWLPTLENLRHQRAIKLLDELVLAMIADRHHTGKDKGDLLSMLLAATDPDTGKHMSDQQVRDEVMTLFLAGHETTANALGWTWYLLSKHPDVERKLSAEVTQVLGGRTPTYEDLPNLKYMTLVIEESMRLYPPVWWITRRALTDDEIVGYHIPAGSMVHLVPYVTHRHPDFWENPEGFDPERFEADRSATRPRQAYFPFGGGPRSCIGSIFAMMEVKLIVAMVVQAYRLHLVPSHPVELLPSITLRPKHGMLMTLHQQHQRQSSTTATIN